MKRKRRNKMKRLLLWVVGVIFLLAVTGSMAMAATATNGLDVSASVASNCRMVSVTDIVFSTAYDPTDSANNDSGAGGFSFRCTRGTDYNMYITGARTMTGGADTLTYELYKEDGRTTVWPSVNPATPTNSPSNSPVIMDVYGRIGMQQDVQAGAYAGSVTVTVEW